ncbi:hypothetical protein E4J94_16160 [Empedobacter tilapiae]|uniref:DUF3291 domain-containing protein n=2 Tax=Empedobacter tilapiae TaxID=2491114 RepID=A0A4Z1BK70_9FLAO|nr:hypothetical protein E4J94_16160 [Empedobacter tilapiae]
MTSQPIFSYHITKLSYLKAFKLMLFPLKKNKGLIHSETMSAMKLGSPIFSKTRIFNQTIIVFAQWENETSLENFLKTDSYGKLLAEGWHIRLSFLRQWGNISGFDIPIKNNEETTSNKSIVAVTIARMKYTEIPRFLRWGRPVEKLVRDHDGTTLSLASIRYPNIISTFSIWKSQLEMTNMVNGHSNMPDPKRHANAMIERNRKNFHFEFTTLRFKPISEHGQWNNCDSFLPKK